MNPVKRRLLVWSVIWVVLLGASLLLSRRLAADDPISEVLLGRGGTTLPLAVVVLLLRIATMVVFPVFVAVTLVGLVVKTSEAETDPGPDRASGEDG